MDLALLVKEDTQTADKFMTAAAQHLYSAYDLNYTIDVHASAARHLAIEIRQDHIETDMKADSFAVLLGDILADLI